MSAAIQQGTVLTKRSGAQVQGPAMSFRAPFWVFENGVAVKNHGEDEAAAFAHYDELLAARRALTGYSVPILVH